MPRNTNNGTNQPPRLKVYLNLGTLIDLPASSSWPKLEGVEALAFLKQQGFEGVQDGDAAQCQKAGIGSATSGRIDKTSDANELANKWKSQGHEAATVHVGYGFEDDAETDALVHATLDASEKFDLPIYIETHRATITQDAWRTIQLTKRVPEIRFNGDFSHFYTGQELVYGDLEAKWRAMQPIFDRVRFLHGRIGSPGCMQVDIGDGISPVAQQTGTTDFLSHFKEMWTRSMTGFILAAKPGDYLIFAPEILAAHIYYARKFTASDGTLVEESDRFAQSLVYARIARDCFTEAQKRA